MPKKTRRRRRGEGAVPRRSTKRDRGRCNVRRLRVPAGVESDGSVILREQELRTRVEESYLAGRNNGYAVAQAESAKKLAALEAQIAELKLELELREVIIAGLHPAATALASLARGQGD